MTFSTGTVIAERYKVEKRLGGGAFGDVYLVKHLKLKDRRFALKLLRAAAGQDDVRAKFQAEAETLLDLVHPRIAVLREVIDEGEVFGFTMDFVDGVTLTDVLKRAPGGFGVERALRRVREVLEALAVAHEHEPPIVHRDLKPDNIMLTGEGTDAEAAKVLDFGIAKIVSVGSASVGSGAGFAGTAAYASPEQGQGLPGTIREPADIYAIGAILYELLAGRPPFISESAIGYITQHAVMPLPPFADTAGGKAIPEPVEAIVRRALEKDPAKRFASATAMIEAIDVVLPASKRSGRSGGLKPDSEAETIELHRLARARIDLPPDEADGIAMLFVIAGPKLVIGRSRPDEEPIKGKETNLILHRLPCRTRTLDPENFERSRHVSAGHVAIEARDGELTVMDQSTHGTWLDGKRLMKFTATPLPARFTLDVGGAVSVEGRFTRRTSDDAPAALLLRRLENEPGRAWLWVLDAATVGPDPGAILSAPRKLVTVRLADGSPPLAIEARPGVTVKAAALGDESLGVG